MSGAATANAQTADVQHSLELDNSDVRVRRLIVGVGNALPPFEHLESVVVFIHGEEARITPESVVLRASD